ncbi:MAG TPA: DUF2071 domain-containing protein [Bryobacteraceae bacterium]|nr:DUF2071 domain-containing protein [Bryobacteraceae bacterium]
MPVTPTRPFLTAEWKYLVMLNYAVDPALLAHLAPACTVIDQFEGRTYVSIVGFRFLRTRVRGLWIPFHSDFDEVNLRFYVKRIHEGAVRRGVVFVREIVPRWAVAKVAQWFFHENYIALPMQHRLQEPTSEGGRVSAEYRWGRGARACSVRVESEGEPRLAGEGSLEQFITEHYWGYGALPDGRSLEYQVEHVPWRVWTAAHARFQGNVEWLYGPQFASSLAKEPDSAFLAEGSAVSVFPARRLRWEP